MKTPLARVLDQIAGGQLREGREGLLGMAKKDPQDPEVLLAEAELLATENRNDEALALARDLAAKYLDRPEIVWRAGRILGRCGDTSAAEAAYRAALMRNRGLALPRLDLAWLLVERKDFDSAERERAQLESMNVKRTLLIPLELEIAVGKGDRQASVSAARRLLDLGHDPETLQRVVEALLLVGCQEEAEALLEHWAPQPVTGRAALAWSMVLASRGAFDEAADAFHGVDEALAQSTSPEAVAATLDERRGDLASAERRARKALEDRPDDLLALHTLASVYEKTGRASEAKEMAERLESLRAQIAKSS